ncbi:hypothetical protein NRB_53190 [Novosphingobium sp. 11B]
MKRARFTEEQIIGVLKEQEAGAKTADLARRHGVSEATIYNWKAKYGGSTGRRHSGSIARRSWRSDAGATVAVPSAHEHQLRCWRYQTSDGAWTSSMISWLQDAGSECSTSSTM